MVKKPINLKKGMHKEDLITREFSELAKNTELGLCLVDKDFKILWANKRQVGWFGPLGKIRGRHCYEMFEHNPKICCGCPVLKSFHSGRPSHAEPRIGYTRGGRKKYYELSTCPIKDAKGRVEAVLEIVRDITYRKGLEDEKTALVAALKEKERDLTEKSGRLKLLNIRLWKTNKAISANIAKLNEANRKINALNRSLETEVEKRTKELRLANEELLTLYTIGKKMVSTLDLGEVLGMIVKTVSLLMAVEASSVRLLDDRKKNLVLKASWGLGPDYEEKCKFMKLGAEMAKVVEEKKPFVVSDISQHERVPFQPFLIKERFRAFVNVPIVFNNEVLGTITIFSRRHRSFRENEVDLLQAFASQAAVAIKNAWLHENVHLTYYNTVTALSLAIEARDPYTRGHAERVTNYAIGMARVLRLSREDCGILKYSGKIHDIGKIAISDMILLKPAKLTPTEKAQVELHTIKGAEIVSSLKFLETGIPIIRHHHERFDGAGYPDGLKGGEIPLGARILAVADSFDAMTSERPYRPALGFEEAVNELMINSGKQFDPHCVSAFLQTMDRKSS